MNSTLLLDEAVLRRFCRKWRICELSPFGLVLHDDFSLQNDVDFLVGFEPEATWDLFDLIAVKAEMESFCCRRVHLVEKEALQNPWRRKTILETRTLSYTT